MKQFKTEQNMPATALDDYFNKALDTIRALYLEQSNHYKLHKTQVLYQNKTLQNTLRILIRCGLAFAMKKKLVELLEIMQTFIELRAQLINALEHVDHKNRDPVQRVLDGIIKLDRLCDAMDEKLKDIDKDEGGKWLKTTHFNGKPIDEGALACLEALKNAKTLMEECLARPPPVEEKEAPAMNEESEEPSPEEESDEAGEERKEAAADADGQKPSSDEQYSFPEDGDDKEQSNDDLKPG